MIFHRARNSCTPPLTHLPTCTCWQVFNPLTLRYAFPSPCLLPTHHTGDFMVWEDDMKRDVKEATSQSLLDHLHEYRVGQVQDRFAVQLQVSEGSMTS